MLPKCLIESCNNRVNTKYAIYCSLKCCGIAQSNKPKKIKTKACKQCGEQFSYSESRQLFCSRSCAGTYNNTGRRYSKYWSKCPHCSKDIFDKQYCNNECKHQYLVNLWLSGEISGNAKYAVRAFVRRYVLERSKGQCEAIDSRTNKRCTESRIVELDHIDGDWTNSRPENLRNLCPTCHALTDTYGSKNRGNGRAWKKNYRQYIPKSELDNIKKHSMGQ